MDAVFEVDGSGLAGCAAPLKMNEAASTRLRKKEDRNLFETRIFYREMRRYVQFDVLTTDNMKDGSDHAFLLAHLLDININANANANANIVIVIVNSIEIQLLRNLRSE